MTTAFEIYWDSPACARRLRRRAAARFRCPRIARICIGGIQRICRAAPSLPLTPEYDRLRSEPPWRRTPSGWCTRYGAVDELINKSDDALVLMNGGDELALSFSDGQLPAKPAGFVRDYFLYVVGWDKDADFHVARGGGLNRCRSMAWTTKPTTDWVRPAGLNNTWMGNNNTRWVGAMC